MCINTNQPDNSLNLIPALTTLLNSTTKSSHMYYVCREFKRDNVVAQFILLSVVVVTCPVYSRDTGTTMDRFRNLFIHENHTYRY